MAEKGSLGTDVARALQSGLLTAGAGIVSAPEEIANLAGRFGNFLGGKIGTKPVQEYEKFNIPLLPSYDQAKDKLRSIKNKDGNSLIDFEPKTKTGNIVKKAAEYGVGGGVFTLGKKAPTIIAALSGATGEGLEQSGMLSEGQGWKISLALDIIGNISHGIIKPNDAKRLKTLLDDLQNNGKLDEAQAVINAANEKGIKLTVPEAIAGVTDDTSMLSMTDNVYSTSSGGAIIDKFTKNRFPQLNDAHRDFLNKNFDMIDVDAIDTKIISGKFIDTLIKGQDDIRVAINKKAQELKNGGWNKFDEGTFNFEITSTYMKDLFKRINSGKNANKDLFQQNILNKITKDGVSDLSINNLDAIYKQGKETAKNLAKEGNRESAFFLNGELNLIKNVLDNNSYYKRASEFTIKANKKLSEKIDSLTIGGQVTQEKNLTNTLGTIEKVLFSEDVSYLNIQKLSKELNKIDASLFPEVSGMLFFKNFTDLSNKAQNPMIGKLFYNKMMGKNEKLTEQLIKGTASAQGKNVDEAWEGFKKLMLIYKSTGYKAQKGSQTASRIEHFNDMKKIGIPLEEFNLLKPTTILASFKDHLLNKRAENLAKIFIDPNGIEKLIKISKANRWGQISSNMNALFGIIPEEIKEGDTEEVKQQKIKINEKEITTGVR